MVTYRQASGQQASSPLVPASTAATVAKAMTATRWMASPFAVVMQPLATTPASPLAAVSCSPARHVRCACRPCSCSLTLSRMKQGPTLLLTSSGASVLAPGAVLSCVKQQLLPWHQVQQGIWAAVLVHCVVHWLSALHRHHHATSPLQLASHPSPWITAPSWVLLVKPWKAWHQASGPQTGAGQLMSVLGLAPSVVWPLKHACALAQAALGVSPAICLVPVRRLHARSAVTVFQACRTTWAVPQMPTMAQQWRPHSRPHAQEGATHRSCAQHPHCTFSPATGATWDAVLVSSAACLVSHG
jgi:hypothetical protein